jgi:MFS family permease
MLLGMLCGLIYFYFSVEHKGAIGRISRVGVWVLMIGFGASFGYTVQGRLSLAVGRALDIAGEDKEPGVASQIHGPLVAGIAIAAIIVGIVIWELRKRKTSGD